MGRKRPYGEHPCTMGSTQHVFLPVPVADGGLPCTEPPPIDAGEECIPTAARPINSGYVCSSVCAAGQMPTSVYQCTNGHWPDTVECVDTTGTLLCTADDSTTVGAGTTCEVHLQRRVVGHGRNHMLAVANLGSAAAGRHRLRRNGVHWVRCVCVRTCVSVCVRA